MKLNKLTIVCKKSQFVLILKEKENFGKCTIIIENKVLEQVKQIQYLVVSFDKNLTWCEQIQHLCSKLSKRFWSLLKLRNYIDLTSLETI